MRARRFIAPSALLLLFLFVSTPDPSFAQSRVKHTLAGSRLGGHSGFAVLGLGDVTGDGVADLAVGAPFHGGGQVQIFDGATGAAVYRWSRPGQQRTAFGYTLGVIDLEDDGVDELVVGSPGDSRIGIYAIGNPTPVTEWRGSPLSYLGASLAVGDVTGDGVPEVVAGAPHHNRRAGAVRVFSLDSTRAIHSIFGAGPLDHYGQVVEISDVSGDGTGDLLVTEALWAEHYSNGRVHAFEGGTWLPLATLSTDQIDLRFGEALTDAGDLDNDGFSDFIVGAPPALASLQNHLLGEVTLYSGQTFKKINTFVGEQDFDYFGRTTAIASDVLGNGRKVLMVGAPTLMTGEHVNAGRVYFYRLNDMSLLGRLTGTERDGWFGSTLAPMGDVDLDGFDEVIIASPLENTQRGKVRIFGRRPRR